jgi:hypothetical protein
MVNMRPELLGRLVMKKWGIEMASELELANSIIAYQKLLIRDLELIVQGKDEIIKMQEEIIRVSTEPFPGTLSYGILNK